jgi:hypothetical protein
MLRSLAGYRRTPAYSAESPVSQTVRADERLAARPRALGAVLISAACAATLSCAAGPRPCRSPGACPPGNECLADRCLPLGAEPVDANSRRVVLSPRAIAVVRPAADTRGAIPPSVTLGGPAAQSEQLLLAFPIAALGPGDVDAAFLLLEALQDADPSAADVPIEVTLAASDWASGISDAAPSTRGPRGAGVGRTRPPAPLRIDVTAHVQALAQQPDNDHGFLLRAAQSTPRGAVYSTGADGSLPRLDVYVRPRASSR